MASIKLSDGRVFKYKVYPLYLGIKKIDREKAKENLLLLKKITDKAGLKFALAFGTALGAIREHNFIEHDEDIDLWVHYSDRDLLLSLLFELRENGFEVARWDRRGCLSIIRNKEYIDLAIYYPDDRAEAIMSCCGDPMPRKYIEHWVKIPFLGDKFYIARDWEEMMEFRSGKDWRIPVAYTNYKVSFVQKKIAKLKEYVKNHLPSFAYNIMYNHLDKKCLDRYYYRLDRYNKLKNRGDVSHM